MLCHLFNVEGDRDVKEDLADTCILYCVSDVAVLYAVTYYLDLNPPHFSIYRGVGLSVRGHAVWSAGIHRPLSQKRATADEIAPI